MHEHLEVGQLAENEVLVFQSGSQASEAFVDEDEVGQGGLRLGRHSAHHTICISFDKRRILQGVLEVMRGINNGSQDSAPDLGRENDDHG